MNDSDIPEIDVTMVENGPIDFEESMNLVPALTILFGIVCIVVYGWQLSVGAFQNEQAMIDTGALNGPRVKAGEYWRLGSAIFLHGSPDHLLGNLVVLYILGMACEHAYGILKFVPLYIVGGLAGSALSVAFDGRTSVGASGAIFGLAGAITVFFGKYRHQFELRDQRVGTVLIVWAVYQFIIGSRNPMIDNFAHLGGFVGGAFLGAILPKQRRFDRIHSSA
jgi:rhomboid protease GluP